MGCVSCSGYSAPVAMLRNTLRGMVGRINICTVQVVLEEVHATGCPTEIVHQLTKTNYGCGCGTV